MQEITFEIDAQRVGRASGYLGGLTVERYIFTGATIPPGTRLAILTRAGVTIAAAEIAEGNAAEVDTNTQEVADLLRYQPLGACESVYIALGNADTIIALIPAVMRKNWLDDEATHPPVPANRYPTKTELDEWIARFDERAAATAAAQSAAETAASAARASATEAKNAATAAGDSAVDAEDSATAADGSKRAAEAAQGKAETAQSAAENARDNAQEALQSADQHARNAAASEQAALTAKQAAETAQGQAKASETAAKASETAAKGSEKAASASEQAAKASEQAAGESATAAAGSASAAKASETAAAESATSASASATAANASANAASSSATAAAKSAAASASSASAAKQSETNLAEAVATAESLDGRLTDVEAKQASQGVSIADLERNRTRPIPMTDVGAILAKKIGSWNIWLEPLDDGTWLYLDFQYYGSKLHFRHMRLDATEISRVSLDCPSKGNLIGVIRLSTGEFCIFFSAIQFRVSFTDGSMSARSLGEVDGSDLGLAVSDIRKLNNVTNGRTCFFLPGERYLFLHRFVIDIEANKIVALTGDQPILSYVPPAFDTPNRWFVQSSTSKLFKAYLDEGGLPVITDLGSNTRDLERPCIQAMSETQGVVINFGAYTSEATNYQLSQVWSYVNGRGGRFAKAELCQFAGDVAVKGRYRVWVDNSHGTLNSVRYCSSANNYVSAFFGRQRSSYIANSYVGFGICFISETGFVVWSTDNPGIPSINYPDKVYYVKWSDIEEDA